jgi:predicted nucleic acid-binding protein
MPTATMTDRVLVDTSVLIAAIDSSRNGHLAARAVIESDPRALFVAAQTEREFLVVVTRPTQANGYGADGATAVSQWREITSTMEVVDETPGSRAVLESLVANASALGKQVHDANLAAIANDQQAAAIITANPRHFERFAHLVAVESITSA